MADKERKPNRSSAMGYETISKINVYSCSKNLINV